MWDKVQNQGELGKQKKKKEKGIKKENKKIRVSLPEAFRWFRSSVPKAGS